MADVKWIKIVTDIFDDEKIVLIEALPEADAVLVIWFKLLCLSGKLNNHGIIALANGMPYNDEMIAATFHRPLNTVRLALKTFEQFGMIEYVNGNITIPNWDKHQALEGLEAIRERNRKNVAAFRARQKLLTNEEKNVKTPQSKITGKITVSGGKSVDIDIDKEYYHQAPQGTPTPTPMPVAAYASGNLKYLSQTNMQELLSFQDELPDDLICWAIDEACAHNVRSYSYVRTILNQLVNNEVKTVAEAKARQAEHSKLSKQPAEPESYYKFNY